MAIYELDQPSEVIVERLIDRLRAGTADLEFRATREFVLVADESGVPGAIDLDDVAEIEVMALLEVEPLGQSDGWCLQIHAVDDLGARLPPEDNAPEGPEEIGLDQFWEEFIEPGRAAAFAQVVATSTPAKRRFDRFLAKLLDTGGPARDRGG